MPNKNIVDEVKEIVENNNCKCKHFKYEEMRKQVLPNLDEKNKAYLDGIKCVIEDLEKYYTFDNCLQTFESLFKTVPFVKDQIVEICKKFYHEVIYDVVCLYDIKETEIVSSLYKDEDESEQ